MIFFKFHWSTLFIGILISLLAPAVSGSHAVQTDFTVFQDFKAVLMYFSEAFLTGAKFGNEKLEGEEPLVMPAKLVHILKQIDTIDDRRLEPLVEFKNRLQAGLEIALNIGKLSLSSCSFDSQTFRKIDSAKKTQELALKMIHENDGIIIPAGWIGHAAVLVIKPAGDGKYNLAFINSGQGLQYHYSGPDPYNVYPHLSKLWIEFENIPQEIIFNSNTAWLIYSLAAIRNPDFVKSIRKTLNNGSDSLPDYFYGSLLANFKAYIVVPQSNVDINDRLVPEQQSGSCTMSSLMGALLYYSDSLKTFHWYRLKLGHVFLDTFLKRFGSIIEQGTDLKFLNVLKNGFFSGGSKHFYGLIRALANHQLLYLEHIFQQEFMHAGLIGSGRSTWIVDKKIAAIEILSRNVSAKADLQMTINLAKSVHEMAAKLRFSLETTHITDLSEIPVSSRSRSKLYFTHEEPGSHESTEDLKFTVAGGGNIYQNILAGKPERLEVEPFAIETFDDFYMRFSELFSQSDFKIEAHFMKFLEIFKGLHAGQGWKLIQNHTEKEQLLDLQRSCKIVSFKFAELSNSYKMTESRKTNMDEITLLGHLQLLTWNLFKALHKLDFPSGKTNWDEIAPPQTIQSTLSSSGDNFISGSLINLPIKSFNNIDNYKLYQLFFKDSQLETVDLSQKSGITPFLGPESISGISKVNLDSSNFKVYMKNAGFKGVLDSFTSLPEIDGLLDGLRSEHEEWKDFKDDYAKFLIVLYKEAQNLLPKFQHFYNLMFTLQCLRLGVRGEGIQNNGMDLWISSESNLRYDRQLLLRSRNGSEHINNERTHHCDAAKRIKDSDSATKLFYRLRHSYAHPRDIGVTDVDSWFNYIKNAKSSKIFDSSQFQYISDNLLNIPKYLINHTFMLFNDERAQEIILELIELIRNTLEVFNDNTKISTAMRRETLVRRVVNISVITTRFISRMDYEFKESVDPVDWASLLVKLYNTIEPYSYFNSPISKLSDFDVSMLNFALSHMCYTYLSVPDNFTNSIHLGFDYEYQKNRKTLAIFHWFVAKINYVISLNMISDDQFRFGFLWSPLAQEEIRFLESLFKEKFLCHYLQLKSNYAFRYEADGYVVEIIASSQNSSTELLVNLVTGIIIENGLVLDKTSHFVNSQEFQEYFPSQSHKFLSSKGKAINFSGVPVFLLPTFMGTDHLMIQFMDSGTRALKYRILRKWSDNWYIWGPKEDCVKFFEALNYKWGGNLIKTFKKHKNAHNSVELVIFEEGAKDPIVKITRNQTVCKLPEFVTNSNYHISIPGLTDEVSAKIINHENYLELHLKAFAEEGITVARQESDGTFIVVYNSLRFSDDPARPFVLTSSPSDNVIRVQNFQDMEICKDQRIYGSGLPGSLAATLDDKKILLLPFAEVLSRSKNPTAQARSYINIERIPIVGDQIAIPVPQSRTHKLLLAYYMILAQHYDSARKLLHPSTSFHHNEAFSKMEL